MNLDLLFDARHIRASGIGIYSRQQILRMGPWARDNNLNVALLGAAEHLGDVGGDLEIIPVKPSGASMYTVQEQVALSTALRQTKPQMFWTPHYPFPLLSSGVRTVVTIHDVLHALGTSEGGPGFARSAYAKSMIRLTLRRSHSVFVPSVATKNELERIFGPQDKVRVAPMRIDPGWLTTVDPSRLPKPLPRKYMVFVGNVKEHKNLGGLLSAFEKVKAHFDIDLVLAGGAANVRNLDTAVYAQVQRLEERVHLIGNLSFEALRATVANAQCLIMPSRYEGVGLPPLEAMAVGTPVLASDIPSLRETCGDAASYFDPFRIDSIAGSITTFLQHPELHQSMVGKGKLRLQERELAIDPMMPLTHISNHLSLV